MSRYSSKAVLKASRQHAEGSAPTKPTLAGKPRVVRIVGVLLTVGLALVSVGGQLVLVARYSGQAEQKLAKAGPDTAASQSASSAQRVALAQQP